MGIDNPRFEYSEHECPSCGEELEYYPTQSGPCHSGLFIAHMDETYWCPECERNFDVDQIDPSDADLGN